MRRLRRLKADIYHVTGDVNYLIPFLPSKRTVLTVHDIGHYLYGLHGLKRWVYKWLWLQWPIRTAAVVTTVSKTTAENVSRYLGVAPNRLNVIENCYSADFRFTPREFNSAYPVVLQVGTKPYKNVPNVIEAMRGIRCKLVLIGSCNEQIRKKLDECGTDYECRSNLSPADMVEAYVKCDLVTFVSIGEGFGLPIIEAQATGRPVVTADIPPMRDVAGDGAWLASPSDVQSIRDAILRITAGLRNAMKYSPSAIAARYLTLYRQLGAK